LVLIIFAEDVYLPLPILPAFLVLPFKEVIAGVVLHVLQLIKQIKLPGLLVVAGGDQLDVFQVV
jgi:hypothetical protein